MNAFTQALTTISLFVCFLLSGCASLDQTALKEDSIERAADNFVAVFDAAIATGSDEAISVRTPIEAVRLLRGGVRGGSSWTDQIFKVPSIASEDVEPIAQKLEIVTVRDEITGKKIPKLQRR